MIKFMFSKGWVLFMVITIGLGAAGGGYAAWTTSLHLEGTVSTGSVNAVWDQQEEREFVGVFDPATGQIVEQPIPADKDVADCVSDLEVGEQAQIVNFQVINAYPSYTCEIILGALITGAVPVHISSIETMALGVGEDVLGRELNVDVQLTRKVPDPDSKTGFRCDLEQPIGVSTQLHEGDRFCAIVRVHATQEARMNHTYEGAAWIQLVQWNLAGETVPAPGGEIPSPTAQADLELTKTDSADPVKLGERFEYGLVTNNHGPDEATDVTLTDVLPPPVAFDGVVASQGSCSVTGGIVTCSLGTLPFGASARVAIAVVVDTADPVTITNEASVTAIEPDPDPANNTATEDTVVNPVGGGG